MAATHAAICAETWRPVPGCPGYEVSDHGRVRSVDRMIRYPDGRAPYRVAGRIKTLRVNDDYGHLAVNLSVSGVATRPLVHGLVLEAFVGPCPTGLEACHNNGDASDNRIENLRWDTPSENQRDRVRHGRHHNAAKTHCKHGHELSPENIRLFTRKAGGRYRQPSTTRICKRCEADYRARKAVSA